MSDLPSNQNLVENDYGVLKISNQTDPAPENGSKFVGVIRDQWNEKGQLKFVIIALGIFVSYLYVGLCQEKILKTPYGDEKEKFKYSNTLVEVSLVSGFIFINSE